MRPALTPRFISLLALLLTGSAIQLSIDTSVPNTHSTASHCDVASPLVFLEVLSLSRLAQASVTFSCEI